MLGVGDYDELALLSVGVLRSVKDVRRAALQLVLVSENLVAFFAFLLGYPVFLAQRKNGLGPLLVCLKVFLDGLLEHVVLAPFLVRKVYQVERVVDLDPQSV